MNTMVVAVTGGIGSGKSTICRRFQDLGVTVIDADELARQAVAPGQPALEEIVRRFGPDLLDADGALRRAELRRIVFSDARARLDLEHIVHPRVHAAVHQAIAACTDPYLVLCVPLLLETGNYATDVHRVVVVDCTPETQRARVMARDNLTVEEVDAIMSTQASRAERLSHADEVINNEGELAAALAQVNKLHERLLQSAGN